MDEVDEKALVAFFVSLAESGIPTDVIAQELLLYGDNRSTVRPEAIKRAITAYLAAAGGGWRPIESAPKDGTPVLFYSPGNPNATIYRARAPRRVVDMFSREWPEGRFQLPEAPYTHWCPLPQSPEAGK